MEYPTYVVPGGGGGGGGVGFVPGEGGLGGEAILEGDGESLLDPSRPDGPAMTIKDFGEKFHISETTVDKLFVNGYESAGSLRVATAMELKEDGFKNGHIATLKHALGLWSPKNT